MKLRSHLIILVVTALLPLLIFAAVMIVVFGYQQRRAVEAGLADTTRALSLAIDRETTVSIRTLEALATSEHLDSGDLKKFYDQAKRAKEAHKEWDNMLLVDPTGQQLINLRRPFGSSQLPHAGDFESVQRVFETGRPVVTNLFWAYLADTYRVGVDVPVIRNGKVRYVLTASTSPAILVKLLMQQEIPPNWRATITDRNEIIIATTRAFGEFIGKPAILALGSRSEEAEEPSWRGVTDDREPFYAAARRSELSGWTLALAIPVSVLEAPLHRSLLFTLAGGLALLVAGLGLAIGFGRRIAKPIVRLSASAEALARGETPQTTTSPIVEVNKLGRVIEDAAAKRQQAEEAIRQQSRLLDLYFKYALNPVVFLDRDFNFIRVNEAYARACQRDVAEFPGHNHFEFYPSEAKAIFEEVVETKKPFQTFTHPFVFPDHPEWGVTYWDWTLAPILDDSGEVELLVFSLNDVTERKRAEEQLKQSLEHMGVLQEINRAISSTLDLPTVLKLLLEKVELLLPYSATSVMLTNRETGALEPVACRNPGETEWKKHWGRANGLAKIVFETRSSLAIRNLQADPRVANRDFVAKYGLVSFLGLPLVAHDTALGFIGFNTRAEHEFSTEEIDFLSMLAGQAAIAIHNSQLYERAKKLSEELLAYHEQLRALMNRLIKTREDEARRIAREIHDESGQILASAYIALDEIRRELPPQMGKKLDNVANLLDQIESQLRNISHDLHPTILDDLGLLPALQLFTQRFSKRTGTRVALDEVPKQRFPLRIETALYRIVQEALNNVTKHAQATAVHVRIQQEDGGVLCLVRDNGIGFNVPKVLAHMEGGGLGLVGIRERVEILKGTLKIQSRPGQGTQLCVTIPLEE